MKYFMIENNNDIVMKISDAIFNSGSGYYQISSSNEYLYIGTKSGRFKVTGSTFMEYSCSAKIDDINELWIIQDIYDANVIDYKKYRNWLKNYVVVNNFYSLSLDEQTLCVQNFAVDRTERDTIYNEQDQINYGTIYHKKSVDSRNKRVSVVIAEIHNRLNEADAKQVVADLVHGVSGSDDNLIWKYESFGVEGTLEGDVDGLFDYVEARTGSAFSGSGFVDKNYTLINPSNNMDSMSECLMDVLKSGSYNPNYWGFDPNF